MGNFLGVRDHGVQGQTVFTFLGEHIHGGHTVARPGRLLRDKYLMLAVLTLVVGAVGGVFAIAFRELIALVQTGFFGFFSERVASLAGVLPWRHLLLAPTVGGLFIGYFVFRFMPNRRRQSAAYVIIVPL